MLVYFIRQPGLVTDFCQPPQLFALAINSPAARDFAGSCGVGPEGDQYKVKLTIGRDQNHLYIAPSTEQDSTHFEIHQTASTNVAGYTDRLFSFASTVLGRVHFASIFRKKTQTDVNSIADTEPLRHSDGPQGTLFRQTDVELVDVRK